MKSDLDSVIPGTVLGSVAAVEKKKTSVFYPGASVTELGETDNNIRQEEATATHSSILAWKSHGQKNLVGYSS